MVVLRLRHGVTPEWSVAGVPRSPESVVVVVPVVVVVIGHRYDNDHGYDNEPEKSS
jgi:hypothetical protein